MKKLILAGCVVMALFAFFVGPTNAGDATLTLDDNAGSSSFVVQDSDKTNQFKVNSDGQGYFAGNVGIGTTNPGAKTHIQEYKASSWNDSGSNLLIENTASGNNAIIRLKSSGGGSDQAAINYTGSGLQFVQGTQPSHNFRMAIDNNGSVGIGTTEPNAILHVSKDTSKWLGLFENTQGTKVYIANEGNYGIDITIGSNPATYTHAFKVSKSGASAPYFYINSTDGSIGIGTNSPGEKLDVKGNITATGSITQGSSKELKKDITCISTSEAIKALNGLNPVKYKYKADTSCEEQLGFIAEDAPELIATQDHKRLSPMDITAVLTKVVQEQQRIISELSAKIERLEGIFEKQAKFN